MYWDIIPKYTNYNKDEDIYLRLNITDDKKYLIDFDGKYYRCLYRYLSVYTEHPEYGCPRRPTTETLMTVEMFKTTELNEIIEKLNKEGVILNFYSVFETFKQRKGIV